MARENLNLQIHLIQDELLVMGSMVEQATLQAVQALKNRDINAARLIYNNDRQINEKRYAVESAVLILIATQQPLAHDLRLLAAMLEISSELERMGDYAKGICKVVINLKDIELPIPVKEFELMAEKAVNMFHRALAAFVSEDFQTARAIPADDDQVDQLFIQAQHFIVHTMLEKPAILDHMNLLLWVAHNLERMADRVTNICERTYFIATGEFLELETEPKDIQGD
ncbi:MAG TPA: phosphate transport system regulatory protein PhoU [Anaerolineaceae bacterium]|jgi:phosphate transport system protein|nr:phosphate transport system regulatory protein PhoU [Anaerolineaceae bacterium]